MKKGKKLYNGKFKNVYPTDDPHTLIIEFKDHLTLPDSDKEKKFDKKGLYNNQISTKLFKYLEKNGVSTHFIKTIDEKQVAVKRLKIIPVEVVIRRKAAGSMAKALGLKEGAKLNNPVLDLYLKNDKLNDPRITDDYIRALDITSDTILEHLKQAAWKANALIAKFFENIGIDLIDVKFEFGTDDDGNVILADEISPDSCRLWDMESKDILDKDRLKKNLGKIEEAYQKVWKRVMSAKT